MTALIVESLIMSEQTSHARLLLLRLPELVDDALLINYAQKALLFPISDGSRTRPAAQVRVRVCACVRSGAVVCVCGRLAHAMFRLRRGC
jgi:hypothetical protein